MFSKTFDWNGSVRCSTWPWAKLKLLTLHYNAAIKRLKRPDIVLSIVCLVRFSRVLVCWMRSTGRPITR